jgi:UDP-N-acetylmuramoyl-L-alanyl-D-glutamate--2,6-diaminopimelate ligase
MHDDGVRYISQALSQGATTIVVHADAHIDPATQKALKDHNAVLRRVVDTRLALAQLSAAALHYPAEKLTIIGITGTKGKTTTTFLLAHILRQAGISTALLSSAGNKIGSLDYETHLTTEQPDYINMFLAECVKQGITHVVMEVAAQALTLHRVHGITFDGVIFTNFDKEHGEFYPTLQDYFQAKCLLFAQAKSNSPIFINADDAWHPQLRQKVPHALSYGIHSPAYSKALVTKNDITGISLEVLFNSAVHNFTSATLLGEFNAYNMLAAVSMSLTLGITGDSINEALRTFPGAPGRLECYRAPNGALCFIDKAHNPSSFKAVLSSLRQLTDHLIVVFGAGGDRDPARRPLMGAIAAQWSDLVFVTSDNPRSEALSTIIDQIYEGIPENHRSKATVEYDRKVAIRRAYAQAKPTSIIALLGKGPDEYELVKGVKTYFSEREIIASL